MTESGQGPRLVGLNHVALEVDNIDAAHVLESVLGIDPSEREAGAAFLDLGDQFIALMDPKAPSDEFERHFGLVVDNKEAARRALQRPVPRFFRDGGSTSPTVRNRIQVVQYDQIESQ